MFVLLENLCQGVNGVKVVRVAVIVLGNVVISKARRDLYIPIQQLQEYENDGVFGTGSCSSPPPW